MPVAADESDTTLSKNKIQATSLLPDGSQLKGVVIPRYDENRRLVGVLKAEAMTLMSADQIAGANVSVEFFAANETSRGRIDLKHAIFHNDRGIIAARESVEIKSDRVIAKGNGLYYSFQENRGFLLGKTTTTIIAPTETTMNSMQPLLRTSALIGLSMVTQTIHAASPPEITAADKAIIAADAVSQAPAVIAAYQMAHSDLTKDLADSSEVSKTATHFFVQADLPSLTTNAVPAPTQPLEIKPGANDTVINSDGGMYFDPEVGVLVYLKNVTVKDRRFNLSGANEVKIFFEKKPSKEKRKTALDQKSDPKNLGGNIGVNFGEVDRIVATGAVLLDQKSTDSGKAPIKASGAIFTYRIKEDKITISGGFPWVLQGANYLRAKQANLTLRISPKAGSFVTEGNWEMGGNLQQNP